MINTFRSLGLIWLVLSLSYLHGLNVPISLGKIKKVLDADMMTMLLPIILEEPRNHNPWARVVISEHFGWSYLVNASCENWTREIYKRVRKFVSKRREFQWLFLSPTCCSRLRFLKPSDHNSNLKEGLLCAIPIEVSKDTLARFISISNNSKIIDRSRTFRYNLKSINIEWEEFFKSRERLMNTPLHHFLSIGKIQKAIGFEIKFIELFTEYAVLNASNEGIVATCIMFILACKDKILYDDHRTGGGSGREQSSDHMKDTINWALGTIKQSQISKNPIIVQLIENILCKAKVLTNFLNANSSIEMLKLGVYLAGQVDYLNHEGVQSIINVVRVRIPKLSDLEFSDIISLLSKWSDGEKVRQILVPQVRERIATIPPEIFDPDSRITGCLEGGGAIFYFRKYQQTLRPASYGLVETLGLKIFDTIDIFGRLPSSILGRKADIFLFETIKDQVKSSSHIITVANLHQMLISLNPESLNGRSSEESLLFNTRRLVRILTILKLNYDNYFIDIDPRWLPQIICTGKDADYITQYLQLDLALHNALEIIYGPEQCNN